VAKVPAGRPQGGFAFPKDRVTFGYLSRGAPEIQFVDSMLTMYEFDRYAGPGRFLRHLWRIGLRGHVNISRGRCKMVRQFLAGEGDWLLMVDDDMAWDHDAHEKQLRAISSVARAKDIEPWRVVMGGLTFGWLPDGADIGPVMYDRTEQGMVARVLGDLPQNGEIRQVGGTGAAFLMVHRKMFEEIERSMIEMGAATQAPWFREHEQPIIDEWDEEGNPTHAITYWVSEDLWFCDQVSRVGGLIFVNTAVEVGHKKPIMLTRGLHETRDLVIA
jgi:hypothetical protein